MHAGRNARSRAAQRWLRGSPLLFLLLIAACAPTAPAALPAGSGPAAGTSSSSASSSQRSQIIVAVGAEVNNLATKLESGNTFSNEFVFMMNSPLTVLDPQGKASPLLAAAQPSQDDGSWVVNPDGTMVTTWKVRRNAVWHDGQPVLASDFAFAFQVYMNPAMTVPNRTPEQLMDRVEPVDDRTLNIHWKSTYPWANRLVSGQLEPLPEHLLGSLYAQGDAQAFQSNPFWSSTSYVGDGPYRLVEWDPRGSSSTRHSISSSWGGRRPTGSCSRSSPTPTPSSPTCWAARLIPPRASHSPRRAARPSDSSGRAGR